MLGSIFNNNYKMNIMKYVHIPAALLFLVMAAIQLNDPDPLYWVIVYTASAMVAGTKFIGKKYSTLTAVTFGMVLAGMLISVTGAIDYLTASDFASITNKMSAEKPYIESAREFGGLLIVAVYFALTGLSRKA